MPEQAPVKSIPALGWFEKIFPILWEVMDFKFKTIGGLLRKTLIKPILWIYIPFIWPIESLSSFFGFKRSLFLFRKIPNTTVWELISSLTIFCLLLTAIAISLVVLLCSTSAGFVAKLILKYKYALDLDCGF